MKSLPSRALPLAELLAHAAAAVAAVRSGRSLDDALQGCPADARPGTQALAFHTMRWLGSAQAARAALAAKAPPPLVDALLLCALAQLWPTDTPAPYPQHTLVDQAVRAARGIGGARNGNSAGSFVNAVLRRFLREQEAIVALAQRDARGAFNHQPWWIERLRRDWPDRWRELLRFNQRAGPMTLRVNARRSEAAAYAQRLAAHGIAARVLGAHTVQLLEPRPVTLLPGFADGDVSVQDEAAQWAAPLLLGMPIDGRSARAPAPLAYGARVLDACAAPGGKAAHLLELAEGIDLLALDRDAARLARVDATLKRLRLGARLQVADARDSSSWWDGRHFDAILVDAPCSGSGVVRRHPDIRWLRRASDIAAMARTQGELLGALWPLLASGGRLLYCTCSVFRAEGSDVIDAFLQRAGAPTVRLDPAAPGHALPVAENAAAGDTTGPDAAHDGFFYALLQKN